MIPYPLTFDPILKEKVWGGRRFEKLNKALPQGVNIGESWEIADLASTSADGAGGDEARSVIAHGPMRGITLSDAIRAEGPNLMGSFRLGPDGCFPLLVKFLDARENLSVQVHPSAAYAAAHPGSHLKTESWYILGAEPGAKIYKGVKKGVTPQSFAAHIADGTVVNDLIAIDVKPGDFHHLPSGTVHAIGAGVLIAEIQCPSDTTFRVFDWGRTSRALHVQQALECIDFTGKLDQSPTAASPDHSRHRHLVTTDYYAINELRLGAGEPEHVRVGGRAPKIWMCVSGGGVLRSQRGEYPDTPVRAGDTLLLPASLGAATFTPQAPTVILDVVLPT